MRLEHRQQMRMSQEMRLAPQMIQSMEILQLATMELRLRVEQELQENPVLELKAEAPEEATGEDGGVQGESAPEAAVAEPAGAEAEAAADPMADPDGDRYDAWERDWREANGGARRGFQGGDGEDPKMEAMSNTAARPVSLQDHLFQQFLLLETEERERMVAQNLIYNIDDNGYLPYTVAQIIESMEEKAEPAEVEAVLRMVQALEPAGVGARDLKECLLLQVGKSKGSELLRRLIEHHLEDIEGNRFPKIAREVGCSLDEVKACVEAIGELNPKPGAVVGGEEAPAILPDVVVEAVDGGYDVRVEGGGIPELRVNPFYKDKIQREGGEYAQVKDYLKKKIESAKWLIDAIHQRHDTLLKIAKDVFRRQQAFLDLGVSHLAPLKMQEVADQVGVHVSTVSRAISEKYAQTPRGIFALKYFFTGGTQSQTTGEMASWETVRRKVLECVAAEDKANPMSDGDIEAKLKADGLDVARRTVTKYRKLLKIPSSRQRRQY